MHSATLKQPNSLQASEIHSACAKRNAYSDAKRNAYSNAKRNAYSNAKRNAYSNAKRNAYSNAKLSRSFHEAYAKAETASASPYSPP